MKWITCFGAMAALAASFGVVHASGPISVYALIDKVTIEQPDKVRIDGLFTVAKDQQGNYGVPQRGYLYLTSVSPDAKREWGDLQSVAGTRQVVGFGSIWHGEVRLRAPGDKQESPDEYTLGNGVVRLNPEQARARALLEFKDR